MVAAVVLLAVVGTACGQGSDAPEGPLTLYSGRSEELVGPLIERFEKETGIDVEVRYGDTAEMANLLAEEGAATPADVFWSQDAGALGAVQNAGTFTKLPDATLNRVSADNRSKDGSWVGVSGRVRVVAYNPERVKQSELPTSVEALTAPRWKGKVGWAPTNGSFQIFVTAFRQLKGDAATRTWLEGMKANGAKTYPKNGVIVKAVADGEIDAGLVNHYYAFAHKKTEPDAKVENHFLPGGDVGGLVNVSGAGVVTHSDDRKRAARLIDYLLSDESQRYFVEQTFEYPLAVSEGVEPAEKLPSLATLQPPTVDLSKLDDLEGTLKLLTEVGLL